MGRLLIRSLDGLLTGSDKLYVEIGLNPIAAASEAINTTLPFLDGGEYV